MAYKPIEHYGLIGDCQTAALVGNDGSIDWLCLPRFDSPSVFAAILDDRRGGHFSLQPVHEARHKQLYFPDTNVLITRFLSTKGVGEITDFMPIHATRKGRRRHRIVRRVASVRGEMRFRLYCRPAFDYGRASHRVHVTPRGAVFEYDGMRLALLTTVPLTEDENGVSAVFRLRQGECVSFVLEVFEEGDTPEGCFLGEDRCEDLFRETVDWWRRWLGHCTYEGRWREMVHRSALVLKLMTYQPTGAIVAAPTTSLPETIGGSRNWDYRYTWIRDASFTLYALLRIGFKQEAEDFMGWLEQRIAEGTKEQPLRVLYRVDGSPEAPEEVLEHLAGYEGSRPVRIGNAAGDQLQLDIYGELMDAVYLYNKHVTPISYDLWQHLRRITDWLSWHWDRDDEGIWEVRGGPRPFVFSKMMCWVAFDRAQRLAVKRSFPADHGGLVQARDTIYQEILESGWSEKRQAFVQSFGSDALDASVLLMPLVFFLSPTDPRMLRTIDAIRAELMSDSLVHRYSPEQTDDGVGEAEGTFSLCTFWLVEALTRAGQLEEARLVFEKMLGYANHLGLYAEEVGPRGEALGNFPQALTHLSLISAAVNLDRRLG